MDGIIHACAVKLPKEDEEECDSTESEEISPQSKRKGSGSFLIRDGSNLLPSDICSTMKITYPWPQKPDLRTNMGKRRANLVRQLTNDITNQLLEEKAEPPPVEKYCTTYDVSYYIDGYKPNDQFYGDSPELYQKYPLYSSNCMSYWQFTYENRNGKPGLPVADVKQPFKRRSTISKPLNEVLD
ncbi:uncharacterized protein [Onthophagus taurus]|uniref:uncharacterized protein n=1 Tax=Onthophagus taurus TaxID=166361 RepID=UPI000C200D38|nr:uncharacterized protein LOC111417896 [Onthophagus taurus]